MLITKRFLVLGLICFVSLFHSCTVEEELPRHPIVIIGGGLMGSSTAWQLAKEGQEVLLLEKQDSIYTSGSSLGEARIARSFGGKNDKWSYLHNRTVSQARDLIKFLSENDIVTNHSISELYNTSPVTYIRNKSRLGRVQKQISEQTDSIQLATSPEEGLDLFEANLPDSVFLLREYKDHSGTINPSKVINKLHAAIRLAGGKIQYQTKVTKLEKDQTGYRIEMLNTESGVNTAIYADKVVAAAGPYNGALLNYVAPYFDELIDTKRVFVSFFRLSEEAFNALDEITKKKLFNAYPCINSTEGTRDGANFSMIESLDKTGNPLIKIGGHFQRSEISDLDKIWIQKLSEKEINWSKKHILRYWNFIDLKINPEDLLFEEGYSCVYSLSGNEVPYVTPVKYNGKMDNSMIVLGAMSGVGAKGCLAYGELASHYILDKTIEEELYKITREALGYNRLQKDILALSKSDEH